MEEEFNRIESQSHGWTRLFGELNRNSKRYPMMDACKTANQDLNRYMNVSPYDHSRIKLNQGTNDYINANLVEVAEADRKYILTQGPLPNTLGHFWLMIWEQKSRAIVMLNNLTECGQVKCHQYWPDVEGGDLDSEDVTDVGLKVTLVETQDKSNFTLRKIRVTCLKTGDSRDVLQFHYTNWPDFGIPDSPIPFLDYMKEVRKSGSLNLSNYGPAVVHCSAGIGRSGTFCLVDSCLVLVEKHQSSAKVDVQGVLIEMRRFRHGLIQTKDQLRFAYKAILIGSKDILRQTNGIESSENDIELGTGLMDNELPESSSPPNEEGSQSNANPSISNNNLSSATELRKRTREEKRKKMNDTIAKIKNNQKESEKRFKNRKFFIKTGLVLSGILLAGIVAYTLWPSSSPSVQVPEHVERVVVYGDIPEQIFEQTNKVVELLNDSVPIPGKSEGS